MARAHRSPGLGRALPRLERARFGGELRAQHRGPPCRRREPNPGRRQQLRHPRLRRGPDSHGLARAASPGRVRGDPGGRPPSRAARGHGNAIAQAYGHPILPLCSARSLVARRLPPLRATGGMWLPETAVDETLEVWPTTAWLHPLAPQATRVRPPAATGSRGARSTAAHRWPGAPLALFFYDGPLARDRVRGPAPIGRRAGDPGPGRSGRSRVRPARPRRNGRRDIRPSPPVRRDGAGGRVRPDRGQRRGDPDQSRRLSRRSSPGRRGSGRGALLVELRTRRRAVACGLWLPRGAPTRLDAAVAGAAPGGVRLAAREGRSALRGSGRRAAQGPVGRSRRLRGRHPGPEPRVGRAVLRPSRAPRADRERPGAGAAVSRAPAPSPPHVHLVRLVLRRDLGDRDGAGAPIRGARAPACPGPRRRRRARGGARPAAGGGPLEPSGGRGRRRRMATARDAGRGRPPAGRGPLRYRGPDRGLRGPGGDRRLPDRAAGVGERHRGRDVPRDRPRPRDGARDGRERGDRRGGAARGDGGDSVPCPDGGRRAAARIRPGRAPRRLAGGRAAPAVRGARGALRGTLVRHRGRVPGGAEAAPGPSRRATPPESGGRPSPSAPGRAGRHGGGGSFHRPGGPASHPGARHRRGAGRAGGRRFRRPPGGSDPGARGRRSIPGDRARAPPGRGRAADRLRARAGPCRAPGKRDGSGRGRRPRPARARSGAGGGSGSLDRPERRGPPVARRDFPRSRRPGAPHGGPGVRADRLHGSAGRGRGE